MVCVYAFLTFANRMFCHTLDSVYRLLMLDKDMLTLWLLVLQMDTNATVCTLSLQTAWFAVTILTGVTTASYSTKALFSKEKC